MMGVMSSDFPTLETPRLRLRELRPDDAPALFAIHSDAESMRWFGADPPTELAQAEEMIAQFAAGRQQPQPSTRWGLEERASGRLLGSCGLFRLNRLWQTANVGYELGRQAWGQGYMREALSYLLPWGFEHLNLHRVEAQVHPDNTPSRRLLEGLGFVEEGRQRQAAAWGGQRHDVLHYGLLRPEFRPALH